MKRGNWTDNPCYYVDVVQQADDISRKGGRAIMLAGPFKERQHAEDVKERVFTVVKKLYANDPQLPWYAWGTCKLADGHVDGAFNKQLMAEISEEEAERYGYALEWSLVRAGSE